MLKVAAMGTKSLAVSVIALLGLAAGPSGGQTASPVAMDGDDIGGTVTGPKVPEAGVWVIAETTELPTKFAKIVVTDDRGRFLIPDLPKANYSVWVRGYGLVDSQKTRLAPGARADLKAVPAPDEKAAAAYYPALYWYAMLHIPPKSDFANAKPGPGGTVMDQGRWLDIVKTDGCYTCHQLGDLATRTFPASLGKFASSKDAWERRIQSGQAGNSMIGAIGRLDTQKALNLFGD